MTPQEPEGGDASVESVIEMASSPTWSDREKAMRLLAGHIGDPRARAQLVSGMSDPDTAVIVQAVDVLVKAGGIPGVREALKHLAMSEEDVGYHIRDKLVEIWMEGYPLLDAIRTIAEMDHPAV